MTQTIPYGAIVVPEGRQRKAVPPSHIASLADSIEAFGLLHAPVVRELPDGSYQLVVGECRFRAIGKLIEENRRFSHDEIEMEGDDIPVTLTSELEPLRLKEVELEENIRRLDLSWQDRSAAFAELHALRQAQNPAQTVADTAREVSSTTGASIDAASAEITRSRLVDRFRDDPQVKQARSLKEAHNIVTRKLEADFKEDLVKMTKATTRHVLLEGDCKELLATFANEQFDLILTDPPYGMGADAFGTAGAAHTYSDTAELGLGIATTILVEGFRVTKPQAHLYLFCDIDHFHTLRTAAQLAGWYAFRTPITWFKGGAAGHDPLPQRGFRRTTEWLLYCIKGDKPHYQFLGDLLDVTNQPNALHPAAKPVELFKRLIARSCKAGDKVLDPCCGLGPIFPAASALAVDATGIELSPEFVKHARNRMYEKE
jgi:methylase of polypeptide subunit release factors